MKRETKAILEMLLCAALWSIAGIFMKFLPWNGFAVASLRSLFAGLTIAAYMVLTKKRFAKESVIKRVLENLELYYEKLKNAETKDIITQYTSLCETLGRKITVERDNITINATAEGIGENGCLYAKKDDGAVLSITSGETTVQGIY